MIEANNADRKELDWQGQFAALTDARRLMRHHPDIIRGALHEFVRAVVPSIEQLRSFTVKNTLLLFQVSPRAAPPPGVSAHTLPLPYRR